MTDSSELEPEFEVATSSHKGFSIRSIRKWDIVSGKWKVHTYVQSPGNAEVRATAFPLDFALEAEAIDGGLAVGRTFIDRLGLGA